jgi:mono/diheme cytochrome c family protein
MKTRRWGAVLIFSGVLLARSGSLLQYATARAKPLANPFAGDASAQRAGAKLYQRECADCHGADGHGAGRAPALAYGPVRQAQPGALFWVLRNGSPARRMPSFAHLPEAQRWQIITFLQRGTPDKARGQ